MLELESTFKIIWSRLLIVLMRKATQSRETEAELRGSESVGVVVRPDLT